jgi:hypothetical protein
MPKKVTTEDFILKSKKVHKDKFDYSLTKYVNSKTKVKVICPSHDVFEVIPYDHINGRGGCPICRPKLIAEKHQYNSSHFIEKAIGVHKGKYQYSLTDYKNYNTKIKIICPKHGVFEQVPYYHLLGSGCPNCCISKGELMIKDYLDTLGVKYIQQHSFEGCKDKIALRFDFYVPDYNVCIEYDGIQHHKPIKAWGGKKSFDLNKKRDEIKSKFCLKKKITLIRINYDNKIDIESIFKPYFVFN